MKAIVLISIILFQFSGIISVQNGTKKFIIEKKESYSVYRDIHYPNNYQAARDENGKIMEFSSFEDISPEIVSQITKAVFTPGEIDSFRKDGCYAWCIVASSGKIVSVSFIFFKNLDPNVDMEKLSKEAKLIKENIKIRFSFPREVKEEGFHSFSFPIYVLPKKIGPTQED